MSARDRVDLPARRAVAAGVLAALLAALLVALGALLAGPAAAHASLLSTDPADGAALATAPSHVSLTFDDDINPGLVTVAAVDAGNNPRTLETAVAGAVVTATWPADAPAGIWEITYRVVSADGHPVSGTTTFSIGNGPSPSTSTSLPFTTPASSAESTAGLNPAWIVGGLLVLLVVVGSVVLRRADRARPPADPPR